MNNEYKSVKIEASLWKALKLEAVKLDMTINQLLHRLWEQYRTRENTMRSEDD